MFKKIVHASSSNLLKEIMSCWLHIDAGTQDLGRKSKNFRFLNSFEVHWYAKTTLSITKTINALNPIVILKNFQPLSFSNASNL